MTYMGKGPVHQGGFARSADQTTEEVDGANPSGCTTQRSRIDETWEALSLVGEGSRASPLLGVDPFEVIKTNANEFCDICGHCSIKNQCKAGSLVASVASVTALMRRGMDSYKVSGLTAAKADCGKKCRDDTTEQHTGGPSHRHN
eukprot:GGOE01012201.1.p1 GENE.GGOE01012201.1~~GGOE01012201.1.p1  ORF type:complete len:145 (+),score=1.23 GGOE01012201.1:398-832(+)